MMAFKTTWHYLRRTPFQSLLAVLILIFSFFTLSVFVIISSGLSSVLNYFESKPEITIFLKDGLDKPVIENIQKDLATFPSIKEVKFISKDKALQIYKEQNKNNPLLTEMVTASILPASFEVTVTEAAVLEQIAQKYTPQTNLVDEVIYQKDLIKSLLQWTNIFRKSGLIIVSIVSFLAFITTVVIIGMKITYRKNEIKISRLLGASVAYIRKPFLFEGMFYGLMGAITGSLISFSLALYFKTTINSFFDPISFIKTDVGFYFSVLGVELILGAFIGFMASWVCVKRYIKF